MFCAGDRVEGSRNLSEHSLLCGLFIWLRCSFATRVSRVPMVQWQVSASVRHLRRHRAREPSV